jgi:hypothetical protein
MPCHKKIFFASRFCLTRADKYGILRVSRKEKGLTMSPDGTYNGYANYQTWNVCLWISNDEGLNRFAAQCDCYESFKNELREVCTRGSLGFETPDGVAWNDSGINLPEMKEFWEENFSKVAA